MPEIVWQDPPARRRRPAAEEAALVAELMANPGRWALIDPQAGASVGSGFKKRWPGLEVTTRQNLTEAGGWTMWARYVGPVPIERPVVDELAQRRPTAVEGGITVDEETGEVVLSSDDVFDLIEEVDRRAEADLSRPATKHQQHALSNHIFAMSDQPLGTEWIKRQEQRGYPITPSEMTFEQARDSLLFFGDKKMAEAE